MGYLLYTGEERPSAEAVIEIRKDVLTDEVGCLVSGKEKLERPDMRTRKS